MEFSSLHIVSFSSFDDDALTVAGIAVALLIGLIVITLGVLLPWLLSALGGQPSELRDRCVEFDALAASLITEPGAPQHSAPVTRTDPPTVARFHLWRHVTGGGVDVGGRFTRPV
jgi:hypothetical protein